MPVRSYKKYTNSFSDGAQGKNFPLRWTGEGNHYCECGQLETVEHVLNECLLDDSERDFLRKVSPELDPRIIDTKRGHGAVLKFLDS